MLSQQEPDSEQSSPLLDGAYKAIRANGVQVQRLQVTFARGMVLVPALLGHDIPEVWEEFDKQTASDVLEGVGDSAPVPYTWVDRNDENILLKGKQVDEGDSIAFVLLDSAFLKQHLGNPAPDTIQLCGDPMGE